MRVVRQSWELFASTTGVMLRAPRLFVPPVLALVAIGLVGAALFVPAVIATATTPSENAANTPLTWAFVVFLPAAAILSGFFNAVVVSLALDEMRGQRRPIAVAFERAMRQLRAVVVFSLISALMSALAALIRGNEDDEPFALTIVRAILAALIDTAWFFATFLALPVIVDQGLGAVPAVKRSLELLMQTFGQRLAAGVGLGVFGFVALLPAMLLPVGAAFVGDAMPVAAYGLIGLGFAWLAVAWVVLTAMGQVYRAAVYLYAAEGVVPAGYELGVIRRALRGGGGRRRAPAASAVSR